MEFLMIGHSSRVFALKDVSSKVITFWIFTKVFPDNISYQLGIHADDTNNRFKKVKLAADF